LLPPDEQDADGQEEDYCDEALRPEAVDTPLLEDEGFEVAEKCGAEEADLGELEEQPPAAHQSGDGDQGVADDSYGGDRDMECAGLLVEGFGGEDGEAAVVYGAAVELFRDGAWRGEAGVHVVNVQRHRRNHDSRYRKQCNQILHIDHSIQTFRWNGFVG
jgi:hypothetical protein